MTGRMTTCVIHLNTIAFNIHGVNSLDKTSISKFFFDTSLL